MRGCCHQELVTWLDLGLFSVYGQNDLQKATRAAEIIARSPAQFATSPHERNGVFNGIVSVLEDIIPFDFPPDLWNEHMLLLKASIEGLTALMELAAKDGIDVTVFAERAVNRFLQLDAEDCELCPGLPKLLQSPPMCSYLQTRPDSKEQLSRSILGLTLLEMEMDQQNWSDSRVLKRVSKGIETIPILLALMAPDQAMVAWFFDKAIAVLRAILEDDPTSALHEQLLRATVQCLTSCYSTCMTRNKWIWTMKSQR